jgi:hypothetical protein
MMAILLFETFEPFPKKRLAGSPPRRVPGADNPVLGDGQRFFLSPKPTMRHR